LILGAGKKSIRLIPSLIITKEQVQQGLEIMYDVFSKIQSGNSSIDK
jgi:4-aminobutyrate aminotransferase-like enzyme